MSLTGVPLIVLAALVAGGTGVATVAAWGRCGRARLPVRAAGVLLTEVSLLATAGLAVNRSELFYPSWSDLTRSASDTARRQPTAVPAALDRWLRDRADRAGADRAGAVTFAWRSAESTGWRLSAPPTVVVPAGYLQHPTWSYPVVLVVGGGAWSDAAEAAAARSTGSTVGPAVTVFLRAGASLAADTVAVAVPHDLSLDLRVTPYHWAVVFSGMPVALPRQVVLAAPGLFPAVAVAGAEPPSGLPPGVAVAAVRRTPPAGSPHVPAIYLPASAAAELPTALRWAVQQTPPPLATPEQVIDPGKTPRPAARRHARPAPVRPATTVGGGDVSGR